MDLIWWSRITTLSIHHHNSFQCPDIPKTFPKFTYVDLCARSSYQGQGQVITSHIMFNVWCGSQAIIYSPIIRQKSSFTIVPIGLTDGLYGRAMLHNLQVILYSNGGAKLMHISKFYLTWNKVRHWCTHIPCNKWLNKPINDLAPLWSLCEQKLTEIVIQICN